MATPRKPCKQLIMHELHQTWDSIVMLYNFGCKNNNDIESWNIFIYNLWEAVLVFNYQGGT